MRSTELNEWICIYDGSEQRQEIKIEQSKRYLALIMHHMVLD